MLENNETLLYTQRIREDEKGSEVYDRRNINRMRDVRHSELITQTNNSQIKKQAVLYTTFVGSDTVTEMRVE